jgi:hypothetical protein
MCKECPHAETPQGVTCAHCDEPIVDGDHGVILPCMDSAQEDVFHYECFLRGIFGSVAHQLKMCSCFVPGAPEGDPPELTTRQAARLAVELFEKGRR